MKFNFNINMNIATKMGFLILVVVGIMIAGMFSFVNDSFEILKKRSLINYAKELSWEVSTVDKTIANIKNRLNVIKKDARLIRGNKAKLIRNIKNSIIPNASIISARVFSLTKYKQDHVVLERRENNVFKEVSIENVKLFPFENNFDQVFENVKLLKGDEISFSKVEIVRIKTHAGHYFRPLIMLSGLYRDKRDQPDSIVCLIVDLSLVGSGFLKRNQSQSFYALADKAGDYLLHYDQSKIFNMNTEDRSNIFSEYSLLKRYMNTPYEVTVRIVEIEDKKVGLAFSKIFLNQKLNQYLIGIAGVRYDIVGNEQRILIKQLKKIAIILAIFLMIISILWIQYITYPIKKLIEVAKQVATGNENTRVNINSKDEFQDLAITMNTMIDKVIDSKKKIENINHTLEESIFLRTQELERSVLTLNAFLDNAVVLVSLKDSYGRFQMANDCFKQCFGVEESAWKNKTSTSLLTPSLAEFIDKNDTKILLSGKSMQYEDSVLMGEKTKHYIVNKIPLKTPAGSVYAIGMILVDITDRVVSDEALGLEIKHRAEISRLVSIGELAAGVGHEINNPLSILIGHLQIIKKQLLKMEQAIQGDKVNKLLPQILQKINKSLQKSIRGGDRISKIVHSLSIYARKNNNFNEVLHINEAISDTVDLIDEIYSKDGINIEMDLMHDLPYALGNVGQFQQVLMNLMNNAKDALDDVEFKKIIIKSFIIDNKIQVQVVDLGQGIPLEIQEKVFNPFFTSKPVGKGTGMGLGLCKNIVEDMQGTISFVTKKDHGTTFTLSFNVIADKDQSQLL